MKDIKQIIEEISECVFLYDIMGITQRISGFTTQMDFLLNSLNNEERTKINIVLNYITIALENKDYLLFSDLLEYELKPFILLNENN